VTAPIPADLALGPLADRFPSIERSLAAAGSDPRRREAFVLDREAAALLRELRPEGGVGEGVDDLLAFLHAAFLHWRDGTRVVEVDRSTLDRVVRLVGPDPEPGSGPAYYVMLAPRRVWGQPVAGSPAEPLDGWYVCRDERGLGVVAVFGLHPHRPGFTIAQARGSWPAGPDRRAGAEPFVASMPGAQEAGLWSIAGEAELLELVHRVDGWIGARGPDRGRHPLATA